MRKEIIIDIEDGGNPLRFKIKQMPATKQQAFLLKLLLVATKSGIAAGIDLPKDMELSDLSKIKTKDINISGVMNKIGAVDYNSVKPLIDELLGCCSRVVDGMDMPCTPETVDGYIDNVKTLFKLEFEAAKLNFDFFQGGATSPDSEPETDIKISKPIRM